MSRLCLTNGVVVLDLHWGPQTAPLAKALSDFLCPWFTPHERPDPCHLRVRLAPSADFLEPWRRACVEPFTIRRSTAAIFNLEAKRGRLADGTTVAWDEQRQTGYAFDAASSTVDFYGSAEAAFIHLIELVRYYALLAEQANGTVVVHSAAVLRRDSDQVVGIVGAKGAGKTSTMLALVASGDYAYFSGDKLLVDVHQGVLRARGWPDYPHIGIGTLRDHRALAQRLRIPLVDDDGVPLPSDHKVLVRPQDFLAAIGKPPRSDGRLSELVLPRIKEAGPSEYAPLTPDDKRGVRDADLFEWPHRFGTATWHGLPLTTRPYSTSIDTAASAALRRLPWKFRFGSALGARSEMGAIQ